MLRAVAIIILVSAPVTAFRAFFFSAVMGLLWLGTMPLASGIVLQIAGVRHVSRLFGSAFFSHQLGEFLGVWFSGSVYDAYHSYDTLWLGAIAIGFVAAFLHWPIDDLSNARKIALQTKT